MTADELRALQAPLKSRYREDPAAARVPVQAVGRLDADGVTCRIESGLARRRWTRSPPAAACARNGPGRSPSATRAPPS